MDYSPNNLALSLSSMVSEASSCLPPLVRPEDSDMLRFALEDTADAFWRMYVSGLPQEGREAFANMFEDDTGEKFAEWTKKYANFGEDPLAEKIGAAILEDLSKKLPQVLTEMYAESLEEETLDAASALTAAA